MAAVAPLTSDSSSDGPVLSLLSKRLRALRKKLNRIAQMEEGVAKGKSLNKEQQEVLRSKPQLLALIDEYERLRAPISSALQEELALHPHPHPHTSPPPIPDVETAVEDLLKLLYFSGLFDVRSLAEYETTMLMRTHERECCITYDTVDDDTTSLLEVSDLNIISSLGGAMLARAPDSNASHRTALAECVRHACLWLAASDEPVLPGSTLSYAALRERLNRIWASNYSTATPEIKPSIDLAAEVGKYTVGQAQGAESPAGTIEGTYSETDEPVEVEHETRDNDLEDKEIEETGANEASQIEESTEPNGSDDQEPSRDASVLTDLDKLHVDDPEEPNYREGESEHHYVNRRPYTNQRGIRGGGRRGYGNGRGGRGSRGGRGYPNGRNQYYDPGYHPSNYYAPRGRSGRGSGPYNHGAPNHGGHSPSIEMSAG